MAEKNEKGKNYKKNVIFKFPAKILGRPVVKTSLCTFIEAEFSIVPEKMTVEPGNAIT